MLGLAAVFSISGQNISLKGKVTDQSGKAIQSAVVTLKSKGLSATTDASGAYSLSGSIASAALKMLPGGEAIRIKNGVIAVRLSKSLPVGIEVFDMRGNLLERFTGKPEAEGDYYFEICKKYSAANMMLVRVSMGRHTTTFRLPSFVTGSGSAISPAISSAEGGRIVKIQEVVDTLVATAVGYKEKKEPIESYEGTVDFKLETANCTATPSKRANTTVSGSGPHKVVIESNSDPGINKGTIYRPEDIGPGKKYPIFLWGEGGCSQNGLSNKAAMGEIASWGYFVIADGTPGGSGAAKTGSSNMGDPKAFYNYLDWIFAQNRNPCSAYYQTVDTTKVASDGFSCGGLMSINAAGDRRFTAMGYTSSGLFSADQAAWKKIHTPFKIMNGGSSDMAYENGLRDYNGISALGIPIIYFSKTSAGHGGDLNNAKGDFNTVNLAWLNWQLKGDEGATGKALLMGPDCKFCKASGWEFKAANWE